MLGLMRVAAGLNNLEDPRLIRLSQLPSRPPSRPALTSRCRAPSRGNLTTRVRDASPQQGPQRPSRNSFVVSGITAYQMAHRMAEVQPGQVTETASAKGRLNRRSLRAWLVGRPDERARALSWNASRAARPSRWSHGRSWSWWQTSSAASRNEGRRRRPRAPCRSSPSFPRSRIATRPAHDSILQTGTWRPAPVVTHATDRSRTKRSRARFGRAGACTGLLARSALCTVVCRALGAARGRRDA